MHLKRLAALTLMLGLVIAGCGQQDDPLEPQTDSANRIINKDGTETLGPPSIDIAQGSCFAQGGVGMVGLDEGILEINVPDGTITQVLLYWAGGTTGAPGDDTIKIDGMDVTGELIGGPTNFFENYFFSAYRADITDMDIVAVGDNSFTISDFSFDFTGGTLDENDGIGMLVIYDNGDPAEIAVLDGLDLAFYQFSDPLDATVPQTFTFAAEPADRFARMAIFAGSVGFERPNGILFTTSAGPDLRENVLGSSEGELWDTHCLTDILIPAGDTSLTVELISTPVANPLGASLAWVGAGFSLPVTEYCIGDYVWYDANGNGCQDQDEMGAEGVEVNLWMGCPPVEVIATTFTSETGFYEFCELMPGDYTVQFVAPVGYEFCEQYAAGCGPENDSNAGSDGITDCVTIVDADDYTIDAALCEPERFCIGDFVWYDEDGDGCQDVDEMGAEGVEVNLWMGCPPVEVIATTYTTSSGYYEFCELMPGDYTVQFVAPGDYEFCEQYAAGCGPEFDSNAGPDGITDCVTLVDADDWTIDAALCMPPMDGCTLTIGYWKTHTGLGNGNQADEVTQYLPIWLGDSDGTKSLGVTTVQMAVDVLVMKTYGSNNNGITKLYAQLLAAKLNVASGASDSAVAVTISDADAFLADHDWMDWDGLSMADKDMVMMWQSTLDDYNNGYIGPGHCDDDDDHYDEEPYLK